MSMTWILPRCCHSDSSRTRSISVYPSNSSAAQIPHTSWSSRSLLACIRAQSCDPIPSTKDLTADTMTASLSTAAAPPDATSSRVKSNMKKQVERGSCCDLELRMTMAAESNAHTQLERNNVRIFHSRQSLLTFVTVVSPDGGEMLQDNLPDSQGRMTH
jgi:hypothetical protein